MEELLPKKSLNCSRAYMRGLLKLPAKKRILLYLIFSRELLQVRDKRTYHYIISIDSERLEFRL